MAILLSKEEEEKEEKIPTDLWEIKKLKDCDFWFLKSSKLLLLKTSPSLISHKKK